MNFPTNQVIQLYVIDGAASSIVPVTAVGGGVQFVITHNDGTVETTDVIKNRLWERFLANTDDYVQTKAATLKVVDGKAVAGQEYLISLEYRGKIGREDTYHKFFSVKATADMVSSGNATAAFYKTLAKNMILQQGVENEPLYKVYIPSTSEGTTTYTPVDKTNVDSATYTTEGLVVAEPLPYFKLGSFPESLMDITVGTSPIVVSNVEVNDWLTDGIGTGKKFGVVAGVSQTLNNSRKLADLELFAKGERGNSNALANWPDNIQPSLYIDSTTAHNATSSTELANGYTTYTVHYAYVGDNQSNQKSERDAIFCVKGASNPSTSNTVMNKIKSAVENASYTKVIA